MSQKSGSCRKNSEWKRKDFLEGAFFRRNFADEIRRDVSALHQKKYNNNKK